MEQITSKENRWVKEYVKLSHSKSYREEKRLFTVESVKLIQEAFENGIKLEMVFVTKSCYEKKSQELEKLFQTTNCYMISSDIEKKISQTMSPQGIFAICSMLDKTFSVDTIYHKGKYVMLVDLQDSGNVGTIIRTAEAVGMDGIILTRSTCDYFNPKVIRGSMGSVFRMPILVIDDVNGFLDNLKENNVKTYASVLDETAQDLLQSEFASSSVLLIGNEGNGLSEDVIANCTNPITIKMRGKAESLNASMAACILMWEMMK
ncbi:RNA methyltransferase [Paludicola sp. MB14-C6]|uniref:TrmH family RNA methyltransferase n=1 Tax=Paludihabitans sp. MB14-C6 TaxID=3070656 RepID=UPI0027DBF764|nr:RNA methyltransferase [Paludicola sp. MB14-C6]WMJ23690.1 RNA methyltransferase [Paludicola sp. MB14-C6]